MEEEFVAREEAEESAVRKRESDKAEYEGDAKRRKKIRDNNLFMGGIRGGDSDSEDGSD